MASSASPPGVTSSPGVPWPPINTAAADYIQLYSGDKATLTESLSLIQQTAAEFLDGIGAG